MGRKCTVEEASLKEKDKVGCREKWRWKDRDSKKDRGKGYSIPPSFPGVRLNESEALLVPSLWVTGPGSLLRQAQGRRHSLDGHRSHILCFLFHS